MTVSIPRVSEFHQILTRGKENSAKYRERLSDISSLSTISEEFVLALAIVYKALTNEKKVSRAM